MGRRHSKRVILSLEAELITEGISYIGFIGNLSQNGMYVTTTPTRTPVDFKPGTTFEVKLQLPSGEILNLSCRVIWSCKTPPHGITNSIGLEILNPSHEYLEFLRPQK